jgi:hypothetical protein
MEVMGSSQACFLEKRVFCSAEIQSRDPLLPPDAGNPVALPLIEEFQDKGRFPAFQSRTTMASLRLNPGQTVMLPKRL